MRDALYRFEEIGNDLLVPPLAALRALQLSGVLLSRAGWLAMPLEAREAIVRAGVSDRVNVEWIRKAVAAAPLAELKMFPALADPDPTTPPRVLGNALGPGRPPPPELWQAIRPVDRFVMVALAQNTRLLHRLFEELLERSSTPELSAPMGWTGTVAHCELLLDLKSAMKLSNEEFFSGRALLLARAAGVRAARRADELLDIHAHEMVGPIELAATDRVGGHGVTITWQAHVSTAAGVFSPAASLLAVLTATAALYDLAARTGEVTMLVVQNGRIVDESWLANDRVDEATIVHEPG